MPGAGEFRFLCPHPTGISSSSRAGYLELSRVVGGADDPEQKGLGRRG